MRYLAIDYGGKRIGTAVGDSTSSIVSPLPMIPATGRADADMAAIVALADEYDAEEFVVGLPLNMDGTEGEQAKVCRRFGGALAARAGKPVHYFDERLSSAAADQLLAPAEFTRKQKKARADSVAAAVILQSFLDAKRDQTQRDDPM